MQEKEKKMESERNWFPLLMVPVILACMALALYLNAEADVRAFESPSAVDRAFGRSWCSAHAEGELT